MRETVVTGPNQGGRSMLRPYAGVAVSVGAQHAAPSLLRRCACGQHTGGGECAECKRKRLAGIQPKLEVGAPGDAFEQEADRMAEQVMRMPEPAGAPIRTAAAVQRAATGGRPYDEVPVGADPRVGPSPIRRADTLVRPYDEDPSAVGAHGRAPSLSGVGAQQAAPSLAGRGGTPPWVPSLSRQATSAAVPAVSPALEASIDSQRGTGAPLSSAARAFFEPRFGRDFSSVRVHSDGRADTLSRQINARAFTLGNDVFFARSQYQPESGEGRRLLAHELTHVAQQSEGHLARKIQRQTLCSNYPGYDSSVPLEQYNCAGLALRTYQKIAPVSAAYDAMAANLLSPETPQGDSCTPGWIKLWLWQYDLRWEDDEGKVVPAGKDEKGNLVTSMRDFHVVAGQTDSEGKDPTNVYSKNGKRPVYGPGSGPSFRPPDRERATKNDPTEKPRTTKEGKEIYTVRSNMTEHISCGGCHP